MNSLATAFYTGLSKLCLQSKTGFFICCAVATAVSSFAQDISIQQIEFEGQTITFSYSLSDTTRGRTYAVNLFSSKDNFTNPLQKVSGDIGIDIVPGIKKIVWNAGEEFGATFQGAVSFEIRSKVYVPFIRLQGFEKTQKRGVPFDVTWTGGRPHNILRFDLLQGDERIATFSNIANSGHCTLTIPSNVRFGENYRFRIYDPKNGEDVVYSSHFTVTRRIPLLFKVLPGALLAGAGYLIWNSASGSDEDEIPEFPATPPK
jgi:hypothetical protein